MGRRGPPPEPTKLRLFKGNPGRRPINEREPMPDPSAPACPPWLDLEARAEWARVVPELTLLGILTRIDRAELAAYCALWSRWKTAYLDIREFGTTYINAEGNERMRPAVLIEQRSLPLLRVFAADFGLSPSARSRVQTSNDKPDNSLDALLS